MSSIWRKSKIESSSSRVTIWLMFTWFCPLLPLKWFRVAEAIRDPLFSVPTTELVYVKDVRCP